MTTTKRKGRPGPGVPVAILRQALAAPESGPLASFRALALMTLRLALRESHTLKQACQRLGIPQQSFARLRASFPEIEGLIKELGFEVK